jgi:hypothetical protein
VIESARFVNVNGAQVIFNDDDVPFRRFQMTVDTRTSERPKGQRHGIWPARTYLGKRIFNCEGDLLLDTSAEYIIKRIELMNAVMPRQQLGQFAQGTLYIRFTGINEELSAVCAIDGWPEIPMEALSPSRSPYLVNFKSFDPRLYGEERSWELTLEDPTGRSYPKTYDKSYPQGSTTNEAVLTNSGNIETYPKIRIYGPITNPGLALNMSYNQMQVLVQSDGLTIPENDYVDLDFEKPTAARSNGANVYNYFIGSDWWALEPAPISSTIRLFAGDWASPARAIVTWRNAYMI